MLILRFDKLFSSAYQRRPHSFQSKEGSRTKLSLLNLVRFSAGNHERIAALYEHDYQRTGIAANFEDECASLASARKNISHAFRHDRQLSMIRNNTSFLQAAYHPAINSLGTHSEGVGQNFEVVAT